MIGLMALIALTGNYNFFNLLTVALLFVPLRSEPGFTLPLGRVVGTALAVGVVASAAYLSYVVVWTPTLAGGALSSFNVAGLAAYSLLLVYSALHDVLTIPLSWRTARRATVALCVLCIFAMSLPTWQRADPTQGTAR
jgi:hypothetical protein